MHFDRPPPPSRSARSSHMRMHMRTPDSAWMRVKLDPVGRRYWRPVRPHGVHVRRARRASAEVVVEVAARRGVEERRGRAGATQRRRVHRAPGHSGAAERSPWGPDTANRVTIHTTPHNIS